MQDVARDAEAEQMSAEQLDRRLPVGWESAVGWGSQVRLVLGGCGIGRNLGEEALHDGEQAVLQGGLQVLPVLGSLHGGTDEGYECGGRWFGLPQAQVVKQLESRDKDLFDITTYSSVDQAKQAIEKREITGAFVVGEDGAKQMLTASAGNAQVTQLLTQMANGMSAQGEAQAAEVKVTDVVANANAALGMVTVLPILIGGVAGSAIATFAVKKRYMRFATLGVAAVVMGLLGSLIMGTWFGLLEGNYWVDAAAIALGMLSIAACITGLASLLGVAGIGLGVVVFMLFGNPWGGSMMTTEFLATPWGTIGAHMPNGTVLNLLKNLSFFPDAATGGQWLTLAIWAVAGLLILWLGSVLNHGKLGRKKAAVAAVTA